MRRPARPAQWLILASLAVPAGLALWLLPQAPTAYAVLTALLLCVAWWLAARATVRARRGHSAGPQVALALLVALVATPELALRAAGFRYLSTIQFGYPRPELQWTLAPDRELFWILPPQPGVNSLGFLGPEPAVPKPDGVVRLLFLGDSCAQLGHPEAYPELAGRLLDGARPGQEARLRVEALNLSLSGYSSHQGRALVRRHALRLEPDAAFVAYGWNDHWQAYGATDEDKQVHVLRERAYRAARTLQGLRKLGERGASPKALSEPRVPIGRYRENLLAIVSELQARGVAVVLLTAPSAHGLRGVPAFLVQSGFARSQQSALDLHRAYNQVVRDVARAQAALLLDLERELESSEELGQLFGEDGIHLNPAGREHVARRVAAFALEHGLLERRFRRE